MFYLDKYAHAIFEKLYPGTPVEALELELYRLYALLLVTKGVTVTKENVHDAWALWKNEHYSGHRFLVPFDLLAKEIQDLDEKYMTAIHDVAREFGITQ